METKPQERLAKIFPSQEPDEEVIFFLRKHWFLFLAVFLIILGMLFVPAIFIIVSIRLYPGFFTGSVIHFLVIFASMYLLFLCAASLISFINLYFDIVILTNKRIIDTNQKGLFHRVIDELDTLHIEDVSSKVTGIFGTFFDFGIVEIQTAGAERNFIFQGIPHPRQIARQIMAQYKKSLETDQMEVAKKIDKAEGLGHRLKPATKSPISHLIDKDKLELLKQKSQEAPQEEAFSQELPKKELPKKGLEGELKEGQMVDLGGKKTLIKFNLPKAHLDEVLEILPSLKSPTVSELANKNYVAVETVVKKSNLERILPELRGRGATDIIQSDIRVL